MDLPCQCERHSSFCLINPEFDWWWWVCVPVCVCVYAFLDHSDRQGIMEIDHCGSWSRRLACVSQGWAGFAQIERCLHVRRLDVLVRFSADGLGRLSEKWQVGETREWGWWWWWGCSDCCLCFESVLKQPRAYKYERAHHGASGS